jgi:hypothetical protein
MFVVQIDGRRGLSYETLDEAEKELRKWGFNPNLYVGDSFDKLLFTGRECKVMSARILEVA